MHERLTGALRARPGRPRLPRSCTSPRALVGAAAARAQDIEPRAYSNAPVGVNFVVAGYGYSTAACRSTRRCRSPTRALESSAVVLAYARVLDLWGVSGKFDVIVPYVSLSGSRGLRRAPVQRSIQGFANSAFRLSANVVGAGADVAGVRPPTGRT
jgi:hypothetical protein